MLHQNITPMESSDEETLVHDAEDPGMDIDTDAKTWDGHW